jgi:hypothetical protein
VDFMGSATGGVVVWLSLTPVPPLDAGEASSGEVGFGFGFGATDGEGRFSLAEHDDSRLGFGATGGDFSWMGTNATGEEGGFGLSDLDTDSASGILTTTGSASALASL